MKKKNGFIATSLIYSFFLVFITLFLTIIADYLQNKVLLNTIESDIKEDINKTKYITDFIDGSDILTIQWAGSISNIKCGSSLGTWSLSNCSSIDSTIPYKVIRKEAYNSSKIDTLVLENQNDTSILLYIFVDNAKFSIENSAGTTTIVGVS